MGHARDLKHQHVKVFIIHSDVDMDFSRDVRKLLVHRLNAQVSTTEDVKTCENWERKLRSELSSSDIVVALLTPRSVDSNWVLHEIGLLGRLKSRSYR